jgi:phosphorylase kinase alpha/beta subunit
MEGNVTERRGSAVFVPLWVESNNTAFAGADVTTVNREISPRHEPSEEGLPPSKVQIQNPDAPRIQMPQRHRGVNEPNFENTEVEELLAMLRETENLEEQGDILQYLVDTQGLDFNTGMHFIFHYLFILFFTHPHFGQFNTPSI